MKKLIPLFLFPLLLRAQPSIIIPVYSGQDLLAGQANNSTGPLSNAPYVNQSGYYYDSNYLGTTCWQIAPQVIVGTNATMYFDVLTTNGYYTTNYYRLMIFGSNSVTPLYDSGNLAYSNTISTGTNVTKIKRTLQLTNAQYSSNALFITNGLFNTNVYVGSLYFGNANTNTTNSAWLLKGKIIFQ